VTPAIDKLTIGGLAVTTTYSGALLTVVLLHKKTWK